MQPIFTIFPLDLFSFSSYHGKLGCLFLLTACALCRSSESVGGRIGTRHGKPAISCQLSTFRCRQIPYRMRPWRRRTPTTGSFPPRRTQDAKGEVMNQGGGDCGDG